MSARWPLLRGWRGRDLKVEPVTKRPVDKFEVPPFPEIGTKARFSHDGFQHLSVAQGRGTGEGAAWEGYEVQEYGDPDAYGHRKKASVAESFADEIK